MVLLLTRTVRRPTSSLMLIACFTVLIIRLWASRLSDLFISSELDPNVNVVHKSARSCRSISLIVA